MHSIQSLKELADDIISKAPEQCIDKRGYNKAIKKVSKVRQCIMILELGITKDSLLLSKSLLANNVERCLARIDTEKSRAAISNKKLSPKAVSKIKDEFKYSLSLNQISIINFILNENNLQEAG